jgi:hypothetical protein
MKDEGEDKRGERGDRKQNTGVRRKTAACFILTSDF